MELICLKKTTVDEVLQQGIYGPLETKPDERRKFLGTIRERIVVALTKSQVAETNVYPQVEQHMKEKPQSHLFLNGNMDYGNLSKYVKLATKYKIEHTLVTNKEHDSEIGLVLAMDHAIDKEDIYITNKVSKPIQQEDKKSKGFFAKIFNR
ncbi:YueI family protein [Bacillus sp. sid0103]|nr:YueI family protein [Bacillus sp. sid0103]